MFHLFYQLIKSVHNWYVMICCYVSEGLLGILFHVLEMQTFHRQTHANLTCFDDP